MYMKTRETRREYVRPTVSVVELQQRSSLLTVSGGSGASLVVSLDEEIWVVTPPGVKPTPGFLFP